MILSMILKNMYYESMFLFDCPRNLLAIFVNPFYFTRKNLYKNIKSLSVNMQGKILDFGCGSKPYKKLFSHCTAYIGCDIDSGHPHDGETIDVFYNGKDLPFDKGEFDSIITSQVLEHVFNIDGILTEFYRVLSPKGFLLITIPFVWNEHEIPYDCARYTSFGINSLLMKHGFEVLVCKKSCSYVETIFSMIIEYIRATLSGKIKNKYLMGMFQIFFIMPIIVCGIILNKILPDNQSLYSDNIILAKKD